MDNGQRPLEFHQQLLNWIAEGRSFVLAQILKAEGSTPQKAGVKALIDETGQIRGTLGGGAVEAQAQRLACEACASGRPLIFDFDLTEPSAANAGPICGGTMRVLLNPAAGDWRSRYAQAAGALREHRRGVLLTRVQGAVPVQVTVEWFPQDAIPPETGFPGAQALESCMADQTARLFVENAQAPAETTQIMVEPVIPNPLLLIVGGGHVGQALAHLAVFNGFDVTVIDDRPEFTAPELFPAGVATQCAGVPQALIDFPIDGDTFIVLVTRGHRQDAEALAACIHSCPAYLGMIGSRRKVALIRRHFIETGLATEEAFGRVFAPIGLELGAVTVPEIATSIMAQLIAVRRRGAAHATGRGGCS